MRIALFLNNLDEGYQISVYQGVRKRTEELGIDLLCIQQNPLDEVEQMPFLKFQHRNFIGADGLLILSSVLVKTPDFTIPAAFTASVIDIPLVSIGLEISGIPSVSIQKESHLQQLMEHLVIDHSYRSFLYMGGPRGHHDNTTREEIVDRELARYKKQFPGITLQHSYGNFAESSGIQRIQDYIAKTPDRYLDAIIAANDTIAIGVQKYLHMQTDPRWKKCAVTGFDDIPHARFEVPPLTTVRQPIEELGAAAVDKLRNLIKGTAVEQTTSIPTELCIRQSCGCPAPQHNESAGKTDLISDYPDPMFQFQSQLIRQEQDIRTISYFGQYMNSVRTLQEVLEGIPDFLNTMRVKTFYLILFAKDNNERYSGGNIIFERQSSGTAVTDSYGPGGTNAKAKTAGLSALVDRTFKPKLKSGKTVCLRYLKSGSERAGFILYETDDFTQPYICAAAIFLANTIQRLRQLEFEKEHSRLLEIEVRERTRQLETTHKKLEAESRKRIKIEAEVLRISELERQRFSMDLHDDICQRLAGISMICRNAASYNPDLEDLSMLIDETLARTRQYAHDSFPMELKPLGLNDAVGTLCHTVQSQSQCAIHYEWKVQEALNLSATKLINIYRIIQEALQNIIKHSRASEASVLIQEKDHTLQIVIQDNGIGNSKLSGKYRKKQSEERKGIGLRSMQYRADQIGAAYRFISSEHKGTSITVSLPLAAKKDRNATA